MKANSAVEYRSQNPPCKLVDPFPLFYAIYQSTNGKPCDGCGYYSECNCRYKIK